MATAEELLSGEAGVDNTLIISNDLRTITIPPTVRILGVESDDEVLRLSFKMSRYIGDIDLSEFSIRVNYLNAQGKSDAYTVSDAAVDEDNITFTWLVGPTATRYKGDTKFNVCLVLLDADGYVDKEFNTTPASLKVLEGLEVDESIVEEYSDILEQWRRELFDGGNRDGNAVTYTPQNKTEEEKARARENIGAAGVGEGLSSTEKNMLLTLFRNAAYVSADMSTTLAQLEALWSGSGGDEPDIPDVPDHTHSYTSVVTKTATCTEAGVRTYSCSCGHSYTQSIPATGHNYEGGVCANCGAADPNAGTGIDGITLVWIDGKTIFNGLIDNAAMSTTEPIDVSGFSTLTITTDATSWFTVPVCYDADTFAPITNNENAKYMGGTYPMEITNDVSGKTSVRIICSTSYKNSFIVKGE